MESLFEDCKLVRERLIQQGSAGIAVDVDETLADSNRYWAECLRTRFGNPEGLTASEVITKYGYCHKVPYWQGEELEWVEDHIRSSNAKLEIPVIDGAVAGLKTVHSNIPVAGYLTGRARTTNDGTAEWLSREGFPLAPILAGPPKVALKEHGIDGDTWKARALEILFQHVIGTIDDKPDVIESLHEDYGGIYFLYSHAHYQGSKAIQVICCPTWNEVSEQVLAAGLNPVQVEATGHP